LRSRLADGDGWTRAPKRTRHANRKKSDPRRHFIIDPESSVFIFAYPSASAVPLTFAERATTLAHTMDTPAKAKPQIHTDKQR
jgi:hypothetical protein